jgi:hypothetical protein
MIIIIYEMYLKAHKAKREEIKKLQIINRFVLHVYLKVFTIYM